MEDKELMELNNAVGFGVIQERERILKIIDDMQKWDIDFEDCSKDGVIVNDLIKLIKQTSKREK